MGNVKAQTRIVKHSLFPEWNQVFAVGEDKVQGGTLEVTVWDAVIFLTSFFQVFWVDYLVRLSVTFVDVGRELHNMVRHLKRCYLHIYYFVTSLSFSTGSYVVLDSVSVLAP